MTKLLKLVLLLSLSSPAFGTWTVVLLRARRGTTYQRRRCFDRLISAAELIGMSLENLRHADAQTPEIFQTAEEATAYADAAAIGGEVVQ
jgi:hypothetical protein